MQSTLILQRTMGPAQGWAYKGRRHSNPLHLAWLPRAERVGRSCKARRHACVVTANPSSCTRIWRGWSWTAGAGHGHRLL